MNTLLSDNSRELTWTTEVLQGFYLIKDILAEATLLSHPKPDAPFCIMTDASNIAVGAVLQQQVNNLWQPLSYFSHKLKPAKTKYSTFNRAIYLAIKLFCHYVEGHTFNIATDNKTPHLLSTNELKQTLATTNPTSPFHLPIYF